MKVKLESGNYRHDDGRIFEHGDGVAVTVSPYKKGFWDNIECGIKLLVEALTIKGYLPYSSCAGHQAVKRRFVSIAFPDKKSARCFVDSIKKTYDHRLINYNLKYATDYEGVDWPDIPSHTAFLNNIYMRGYEDYFFVEISIGLNTPPLLRNIFKILDKKINRETVTTKLIKAILQKDFPAYEF